LRFDLLDNTYGIRVTWNPVLGATKYRVYRALTATGAYKYIETTDTHYDYVNDSVFTLTGSPPEETTAYINKLSAAGPSWVLGGNVGIGTTDPQTYALRVEGAIMTTGPGASLAFRERGAPTGDWVWYSMGNAARLYHQGGGVDMLWIEPNGDVHCQQGIWSGSSRKLKTKIRPIKDALEKVRKLTGVSFDWKSDGKHTIGLIAEDVGEIVPEAVDYEENGKDARGLDYGRLVALLIEAVKEQQGQIEELKGTVKSLLTDKSKTAGLA
jgi:hypothetical protein